MTVDLDLLLEKAEAGEIAARDVSRIVELLKEEKSSHRKYTMLHIIGHSGNTVFEPIVAKYLNSPDDPMLAQIALLTLCHYWGLNDKYIGTLTEFVRGVHWDEYDQVRLTAISQAGEFLRGHAQDEENEAVRTLLALLVGVFDDASNKPVLREAAYSSMGRAYGKVWGDLPSAAKPTHLQNDVDPQVLEWARSVLRRLEERKSRK